MFLDFSLIRLSLPAHWRKSPSFPLYTDCFFFVATSLNGKLEQRNVLLEASITKEQINLPGDFLGWKQKQENPIIFIKKKQKLEYRPSDIEKDNCINLTVPRKHTKRAHFFHTLSFSRSKLTPIAHRTTSTLRPNFLFLSNIFIVSGQHENSYILVEEAHIRLLLRISQRSRSL
ncbi:hypothetical protein L2E82_16140 [Cichorium intybus]|uniref:Uncharacterized protein n=1 Tax=Cichorium intybus TaxID=13427 RepID=A0ACB9F581_CICIN|nr:hypothetical protein L2E82_16140 [Cichorium intybus]